jgi:hypothetical protein
VVKSGHSGKVLAWDSLCVVLEDEAVGVGRVSDNDGLAVSFSVVSHSFTNSNENGTIILEEISTFHAWSSWLGANHESVVNIFESSDWINAAHNLVEEWEGAIVEFSHDSLELLRSEWEINEVENNSLILSEELTGCNSVKD